jgi:hypothetical protein
MWAGSIVEVPSILAKRLGLKRAQKGKLSHGIEPYAWLKDRYNASLIIRLTALPNFCRLDTKNKRNLKV